MLNIYIGSVLVFFENWSAEHKEVLSNFVDIARGTKISGETNILRTLDIGFPLAFSVNETLSFHNKFKNQPCVGDLQN